MQEIFENYIAIALSEKPLPRRRGFKGLNRKYFRNFVSLDAGARSSDLLKLIEQGDVNARRLLIDAAVKGYEKEAEKFLKFQQSKELANAES